MAIGRVSRNRSVAKPPLLSTAARPPMSAPDAMKGAATSQTCHSVAGFLPPILVTNARRAGSVRQMIRTSGRSARTRSLLVSSRTGTLLLRSPNSCGMAAALRAVDGVERVWEDDREVWGVSGTPSGEALVRAAAHVIDHLAARA